MFDPFLWWAGYPARWWLAVFCGVRGELKVVDSVLNVGSVVTGGNQIGDVVSVDSVDTVCNYQSLDSLAGFHVSLFHFVFLRSDFFDFDDLVPASHAVSEVPAGFGFVLCVCSVIAVTVTVIISDHVFFHVVSSCVVGCCSLCLYYIPVGINSKDGIIYKYIPKGIATMHKYHKETPPEDSRRCCRLFSFACFLSLVFFRLFYLLVT